LKAPADVLGTVALYILNLVIATGTTISVWLVRYFREPVVIAAKASASQLRDANRSVNAERTNHESLKQRRHQRRDSHAAGIQKANLAHNTAQAVETAKLVEIDAWLKNALKQLHDKRRSLAGEEADEKRRLADTATKLSQRISTTSAQQQQELNQLDSSLGQRIRSQEAQLQQVTSTRNLELQRALKEYQDQIVLSHLHRYRIADHSITGIGTELKRRLAEAGFFSAADVATRPINVPGIGATKRAALQAWVSWLDINTIRPREAPKALPSHKAADIERRYEAPIRQLEQSLASDKPQFVAANNQIKKKYTEQKRLLEGELATEETRVRQQTQAIEHRFDVQRNVFSSEEGQARQLATNRMEEWTQQFRVQMSQIAAEVERLRNNYASDLEQINKDLAATAKRVRELYWRRDQIARMHEAYSHLTFRRYCTRVFGGT
jgi:cytochrome c556